MSIFVISILNYIGVVHKTCHAIRGIEFRDLCGNRVLRLAWESHYVTGVLFKHSYRVRTLKFPKFFSKFTYIDVYRFSDFHTFSYLFHAFQHNFLETKKKGGKLQKLQFFLDIFYERPQGSQENVEGVSRFIIQLLSIPLS